MTPKHICPICQEPYEFDENGDMIQCHSESLDYGRGCDTDLENEYD
jgi:hypothetical protein